MMGAEVEWVDIQARSVFYLFFAHSELSSNSVRTFCKWWVQSSKVD